MFVALTLSSAIAGILGKENPQLQRVCWILAIIFVAGGVFVVHRKRKRQLEREKREKVWSEREAQRKAGAAFRSLAPFEERDELPGRDRKIEARSIATRIASDDFLFGVVCGDTGCGKTSLLRSEVTRVLKNAGLKVAYVRNPRRLESTASQGLSLSEQLTNELKTLISSYLKEDTRVLIVDQFEEWFIEYPEPEHRLQIIKSLKKLSEGEQRLRIICAIRREFLIDFHDLSDELPQALNNLNQFHIKNFTIDQAIDVIKQCATADGLAPDDEFAEIVANDLAEDKHVRPPELQIVCTQLAVTGTLETSKYRQAGGTAGILAHYIQDAVESSRDRTVAARLLRSLCDFPAHAKRKAKTIAQLTTDVEGASVKTVEDVVRNFVMMRILAAERAQAGEAYSLMHDYLVEPIQLATSDDSTRSEEANQLLRFYLADKKSTIPYRKLRVIRKFADRDLRQQQAARRLLRKSTLIPLLQMGLPLAGGLVIALGIVLVFTARLEWRSQFLERQPGSGVDGVSVDRLPIKGRIATSTEGSYYAIWDTRTGRGIWGQWMGVDHRAIPSKSLKYLILESRSGPGELIETSNWVRTPLPDNASRFRFSSREILLAWEQESETESSSAFFSLPEKRVVLTIAQSGTRLPLVADQADRAVIALPDGAITGSTALFEISSGKQIAKLQNDLTDQVRSYDLSEATSEIAVVFMKQLQQAVITCWDLSDGNLKGRYSAETQGLVSDARIRFNADGTRIILSTHEPRKSNKPEVVLDAASLKPVAAIPYDRARVATYRDSSLTIRPRNSDSPIMFWGEKDGTSIFDTEKGTPFKIAGLFVGDEDKMFISRDHRHALLQRKEGAAELWDLQKLQLVATLPHNRPIRELSFAVDDSAVILEEEGDLFSLFDVDTGQPLLRTPIQISGAREFFYERDCKYFNVWNSLGEVVRYTEGRSYFGKFFPTRRCS